MDLLRQQSARKGVARGRSVVREKGSLKKSQVQNNIGGSHRRLSLLPSRAKVSQANMHPQRIRSLAWFSNDASIETLEEEKEKAKASKSKEEIHKAETMTKQTKKFLSEESFPIGSYDLRAIEKARKLIWDWSQLRTPASVNHSVDLIDRLVQEQGLNFQAGSDQRVASLLNSGLLTVVARNWSICWQENNDLISPQALLEKMEAWSEEFSHLAPETKTMRFILTAAASKVETEEDALYVESLLQWMKNQFQSGNVRISPTINEYNIVLNAMAKAHQPERAEQILYKLCEDYNTGVSMITPDAVSMGTVLYAWKRAKRKNGGKRAEAVLDTMMQLGEIEDIESLAQPDAQCYYAVLYSWCAPRTKHSLEQAERFLQRMEDEYKAGKEPARPYDACYGLVIHSWTQAGGCEEGERVLRWMHNDHVQNNNLLAKPSSYHFNPVIACWARKGGHQNLARAFSIFENMKHMQVEPDSATYGCLMIGLSRSKDKTAGEHGERLLREQLDRYKSGDESCKPDALTYNAAMHCYSSVGNAMKSAALLKELIELHKNGHVKLTDDRPFCTALAALSRSRHPNKVEMAESLHQELKQLCEAGIFDFQPSAASYASMQGCWASATRPNSGEKCWALLREMEQRFAAGDEKMRPHEANYKTVIDAFARTGNPVEAQGVFTEMLQRSLDNPAARPGNDSCKAVLASWLMSDAPDAIERVVDLMDQIAEIDLTGSINLKLNRDAYYLLFDICVKSKNHHITAGVERILHKMQEICEQGHGAMAPDSRCYNITINCLGKVDNAERSEALFWNMFHESVGSGNENLKPDAFTISTVLMAWSRSSNQNATRRAEVFFERIEKLISTGKLPKVKLDRVCYISLLHCLANARTVEATEKAETVLASLQERYRAGDNSLKPNEECYRALVKCRLRVGNLEGAESLVLAMHEFYQNGEQQLEPTREICKLVFTSWLKSNDDWAPLRAEQFLQWMSRKMKEKEHAEDYASLLRCWARSRRPDSGARAEKLLQTMFRKFGRKRRIVLGCLSDVVCAFARANDLERAEALLLRICDDYLNNRTDVQPDTRAFVAVLAAISRATPPGAGMRCLRIVQTMRQISSASSSDSSAPQKVLDVWSQSSANDRDNLLAFLAQMEGFDTADSVAKSPGSGEGQIGSFGLAFKY